MQIRNYTTKVFSQKGTQSGSENVTKIYTNLSKKYNEITAGALTRNAILKKVKLFKDNIRKIINKFTRMHNFNRYGIPCNKAYLYKTMNQ